MTTRRALMLSHSLPNKVGDGGQQRIDALVRGVDGGELELDPYYFLWEPDAAAVIASLPALQKNTLQVHGVEPDYVWWLHEYFLGLRAADDQILVERLAEGLVGADVLILDHLWGWALAQRAIVAASWEGAIVYHAHNAEAEARIQALGSESALGTHAGATLAALRRYEASLCQSADLVLTCTDADTESLRSLGARRTATVPNGGNKIPGLIRHGHNGRYLYVASAWHPNAHGFSSLVFPALRMLRTDVAIDVVGSVCTVLTDHVKDERQHWLAQHDVELHGRVTEDELSDFYSRCRAVMVPLSLGTGSCIKTAEALVNGIPALSTTHGIRGYEQYVSTRQHAWRVADTPAEWAEAFRTWSADDYRPEPSLEWGNVARLLGDVVRLAHD